MVFPADSVVTVGETLSLPCTASGIPPPQITWFRDGSPLTNITYNITNSVFSNASNYFTLSVVHLCDLDLEDSNTYECRASNTNSQGETVDTASFMVEVQGKGLTISSMHCYGLNGLLFPAAPPAVTVELQDQIMPQGGRVELRCTVSGSPLPTIEWRFVDEEGESVVTADSTSIRIDTMPDSPTVVTSTLTLLAVQLPQAGEYACVGNNTLNSTITRAVVTVFGKPNCTARELLLRFTNAHPPTCTVVPSIMLRPEPSVDINVGASGVFACIARGVPLPAITWFQNGMEIVNGTGNFNIDNSAFNDTEDTIQSLLEICPIQPGHAGTYSCQARNAYGNDTATLEVVVNEGKIVMQSLSLSMHVLMQVIPQFLSIPRTLSLISVMMG